MPDEGSTWVARWLNPGKVDEPSVPRADVLSQQRRNGFRLGWSESLFFAVALPGRFQFQHQAIVVR